VMKTLNVRIIYNLSGVVVNEPVAESIEVRKYGQGRQKNQRQDVSPQFRMSRSRNV
jgi:hypothetical protein